MPLIISRNDIREVHSDAIVNPTDAFYSGSGGVDKQIHLVCGKQLDEYCIKLEELKVGECVITESFEFKNCKYIIHTHGPNQYEDKELLKDCYRNALNIAKENALESICFPLISSGSFGIDKRYALEIARETIVSFLKENEMFVELLVYDDESFKTANKLYDDIKDYLKKNLTTKAISRNNYQFEFCTNVIEQAFEADESFSEAINRIIMEKDLNDPDVYKNANMDRKLFNHIKNNKNYHPKKETAVALAIGLKLNLRETNELLEKAGFILSKSSKFDLIIRHCIENKVYDVFEINELLFAYDQKLLGC